jgi:hypothetical protein
VPPRGENGWSRPQIIIAIISLFMAAGGSYLAIERDDSREVQKQLNESARDMALLAYRVGALEQRERDRLEDRRGR